jgi:lipopolysaccharide transport system permease protein
MQISEVTQKRGTALPHLETSTIVVEPRSGLNLRLNELWHYRDLLYFLVWRDIKVRYKQTALGASWAILQPVLATIVFSIFFGRLAKMPSDGVPYPVFAYVGLLPWQLFAYSLTESSNSLVSNQNLIRKVYFPRLIIPLSAVLAGLVDFAIAFFVLVVMLLAYGIRPGPSLVVLPLFLALAVGSALAAGLWLSALNVQYRDVRYTIPFLTQIWMFVTPVVYPSSLVPERWRAFYGLNPMAGVVEGFRWAFLGKSEHSGSLIWVSASMVVLLLVGGLAYFRRMESTFADVV